MWSEAHSALDLEGLGQLQREHTRNKGGVGACLHVLRTKRGAALGRQAAVLEAGAVWRRRPALSVGGFTGGRCGVVQRCVVGLWIYAAEKRTF